MVTGGEKIEGTMLNEEQLAETGERAGKFPAKSDKCLAREKAVSHLFSKMYTACPVFVKCLAGRWQENVHTNRQWLKHLLQSGYILFVITLGIGLSGYPWADLTRHASDSARTDQRFAGNPTIALYFDTVLHSDGKT
jgi:hypothetical protein